MAGEDEYGNADLTGPPPFKAAWMPPAAAGRARPVLHLARSRTEACSGAVYSETPGVAVHVSDDSGTRCAWMGTTTLFGKVVRKYDAVDDTTLRSLVLDTLEAGEQDVWLSGNDPELTEELADLAREDGFRAIPVSGEVPQSVEDPFSLFDGTHDTHVPGGREFVVSFCKVDTSERAPLAMGDTLTMVVGGGGSDILYLDPEGVVAGMHGRLPAPAEPYVADMLRGVAARVEYVSWGREIRGGVDVDIQTVVFEIPVDVSRVLRDAKLPPSLRGSGC